MNLRSFRPAGRVFSVLGVVVLSLSTGFAESPALAPTPAVSTSMPVEAFPKIFGHKENTQSQPRSRRVNNNRRARILRNIQDTYSHRYEVAGGGGYLRFRTGQYLKKSNEISFFMTGTRMFSPRWGVLADVQGSYGAAKISNPFALNNVFRPNVSEYNFTGGAVYRLLAKEKYTVGVAGTGGVTLSKFGGDTKGLPSQDLGMWKDSNANPTFTVSFNLDYNVFNNLAFRVQPKYIATTFGSTVQNNLGVNFGIVYRFGRQ